VNNGRKLGGIREDTRSDVDLGDRLVWHDCMAHSALAPAMDSTHVDAKYGSGG